MPIHNSLSIRFSLVVEHCSSLRYINVYTKFLRNYTVIITALWATQHSTCTIPLSTWLPSKRNLTLYIHYEDNSTGTLQEFWEAVATCLSFQNVWPTTGVLANQWTLHQWSTFLWIFSDSIWSKHLMPSTDTPLFTVKNRLTIKCSWTSEENNKNNEDDY